MLFDKGYRVFDYFWALTRRAEFFVTRAKDNLNYRVVKNLPKSKDPLVLKDQIIVLKTPSSRNDYPGRLRLVTARVEVDRQERVTKFLTNNPEWSASSVTDLYHCRWQIEVFFKQIKQTLKLADFLGHNANAVEWQLWMALLLVHVPLRFQTWRANWAHSFSHLLSPLRAALWQARDLSELLKRHGTAGSDFHDIDSPRQAEFPCFESVLMGQHT